MSDQPTKGPTDWVLCHPKDDDDPGAIWLETSGEPYQEIVFRGPDRKANARKFLHIDELVEALKQARPYVNARANYGHYDTEAREDLTHIDAILSQIEGKP